MPILSRRPTLQALGCIHAAHIREANGFFQLNLKFNSNARATRQGWLLPLPIRLPSVGSHRKPSSGSFLASGWSMVQNLTFAEIVVETT